MSYPNGQVFARQNEISQGPRLSKLEFKQSIDANAQAISSEGHDLYNAGGIAEELGGRVHFLSSRMSI